MQAIRKDFPGVRALDGVSFDLREGEIHALVGENGAGKSTLMKILAGVYPAGSFGGEISLGGRPARFHAIHDSEKAGIAVIHQELALVPRMTVAENIFLGEEPGAFGLLDRERMESGARALLAELGLAVDPRVETIGLGVGERQLVEIAKALRKRSRVLVLDEPTAALAGHEIALLFGIMRRLKAQGVALVYISHKLDEVFEIADRITVLRDGRTVLTGGARDLTRDAVVQAMVGRELGEMFPRIAHEAGRPILQVEGLTVADPSVPGRRLLDGVSFHVREGEVLGIAGLLGAGRTELLLTLFGRAPGEWTGRVRVEGREVAIRCPADAIRAGLALVPEDRKQMGLVPAASVQENLSMAHLREFCTAGVIDAERETSRCRAVARELDVRAPSLRAAAETLSGGNQQKVVLGKWLLKRPKVLFLDEPTRGIDVGAKAEIHRLIGELTRQGVAVVMVSSEMPEVLGVSDRILVLRAGRVAGEFPREEATPEGIMRLMT
jgi:D-xylose transport system ATP-binding protein